MNFKQLTEKRESCRSYSDKAVDKKLIVEILEAAANTPSACNSQPWKLVVCTDDVAKKMPECIIKPEYKINRWVGEAPAFIVVCETKARLIKSIDLDSQFYAQMDIGNVAGTICYAATDVGLSTCLLGMFDDQKLKQLLGIPEDITIRLVITLGYAKNEGGAKKARKDFDEIVSFNSWE